MFPKLLSEDKFPGVHNKKKLKGLVYYQIWETFTVIPAPEEENLERLSIQPISFPLFKYYF